MKTYTKIFGSIYELSQFVDTDDLEKAKRRDYGSSTNENRGSSFCNMTTAATFNKARNGGLYPEGAKNIEPIELDAAQINAHDLAMPQAFNAVAGYRANVPAFLAGSPYSMVRVLPAPRPNRLLRIAVHVGKSDCASQAETYNRGNAILSVLNALNALGFALELWALWRNRGDGGSVSIETCIKKSDQSYSPDSIAFSICNTAFQKRLCWRVAEMAQRDHVTAYKVLQSGYGNGMSAEYPDFDLSFGWLKSERCWERKESALNRVVKMAGDQLDHLRKGAAA